MNKIKSIGITKYSIFCGYKHFLKINENLSFKIQKKKIKFFFGNTRSIPLLLIFLISLFLANCGGGGGGGSASAGNDQDKDKTENGVKGKVMDGYIKNATVFLDLDNNQILGGNEPKATTDADGNFFLNPGSHDPKQYSLVAVIDKNAVDKDTGHGFAEEFRMSTIKGETLISPISTMVRNYAGNDIDKAEADKVATKLLGTETVIDSDYVSKTDENSKKIHKYAQVIARMQGKLAKKLEKLGIKGDDKQIAIIATIVSVLKEVKEAVDKDSSAKADEIATGISPEKKLPDKTEDITKIVDKEKKRRSEGGVITTGVTADYYGVGHHIFFDDTAKKKQQMSLAEIKLKVPGELKGKYTLSLKKPDGNLLSMKTKGETKYCKDEDCWEYETTRSDTTANLLPPGTYQFILTRSADKKTEIIAEKILKPFIDFKDNTEPALFFSIGTDNLVKAAYAVPSVDTGIYYNRLEIRKKGDQPSRKRGGRVLGVFLDFPSDYKKSNAAGLEYSYNITDGDKYEERSNTRYFAWKPFLTKVRSDFYLDYISMYNRREQGRNSESLYPRIGLGLVNAKFVKTISILDAQEKMIYKMDATIDYAKQICVLAGKAGYENLRPDPNPNIRYIDDKGRYIGCFFEIENGKKITAIWMSFVGDSWQGKRTVELSDSSGDVVAKIGKFFKDPASALPVTSIDTLNISSPGSQYFDFSWTSIAGNPYNRLYFMSIGSNGRSKTVYKTSRKRGDSIRFSMDEFRKNIGNKYCQMPDSDFGDTKRLTVRISAYTHGNYSAVESRSDSKYREVKYDCKAANPLPKL